MQADSRSFFSAGSLSRSYRWAGYSLGFALGGFFDGILLHQLLQWHHLLSALEGEPFGGLRFQILADGLFHALMYIIGGIGFWLLWRSRAEFGLSGADRLLFSNALIGFGIWHIMDAVISHWLLGIHRIKMDADYPLLWDLMWFFAFGLAPLLFAWFIRPDSADFSKRLPTAPLVLGVLVVTGAALAALPPGDLDNAHAIVVFVPGITPAGAYAAMTSVNGQLVWSDPFDHVWAIAIPPGTSVAPLYANGALLVSGSIVPLGCLDWFRS
ncbi:MAG: DUF2243 domain-containing protein [Mesorhizobium sp.]|nr:DUF2243 domain-containing protein [Mesorhizobium sp.]